MYKSLSPSVLEEMTKRGSAVITVKGGWETTSAWVSIPGFITYCLGDNREHIFRCYMSRETNTIQITNVEATKLIADKKSLVDAYMYVALKGVIKFAESMRVKRLIFDSYIPSAADHMIDLGFRITSKGLSGGSRGLKMFKE